MNLYPSILTDAAKEAQSQAMWAAGFSKIRTVQVDIIDGQFVDNCTITPADLPGIDFGELSVDLHLMTEEPLDFVYEAIEHKDQIPIRAVIGQVERMSSQEFFLETVEKQDWQTGLSLDLFTPLEAIDEVSWDYLDIIQLMSIEAGFQGQEFQKKVLKKITELKKLIAKFNRAGEIIVDGGVKPSHVTDIAQAGAHSVVVGSGLWQAQDLETAVDTYLE